MKQFILIIFVFWINVLVLCAQITSEYLGLKNKNITSLSFYSGIIAVGTDKNGVYIQDDSNPTPDGWTKIGLDSLSVRSVYAHKSGPVGWAVSAGIRPEVGDSVFFYCSFVGNPFVANTRGISDSLTNEISAIDGFPDLTICGETYAAGGYALYRRLFGDSLWRPVYTTSAEEILQTVRTNEQFPGVVLAGGADGWAASLLIKSLNFGNTWENISPGFPVFDVEFNGDSAQTIFTACGNYIRRSLDAGNSWETVFDGISTNTTINSVLFHQFNQAYFIGGTIDNNFSLIMWSGNLGENWNKIISDITGPVLDMRSSSAGYIYYVTPDSGVYRLNPILIPGVNKNLAKLPERIRLEQCYPNPFNNQTTISFSIPKAGNVRLTVFDITGRVVKEILNEWQTAGTHSLVFNAEELSSGVYFYRIQFSDNHYMTRKLLLLK